VVHATGAASLHFIAGVEADLKIAYLAKQVEI